ncbi:sigma-70 family RNA polymerase sigma factor [Curvibacter sp. CHRR-16]|uniref:sigma-70 family RNA polymerase sigma factor n=1 Tax=Curvibacter sp. CHRR-16 TaxID=2835872 RepID=UPI001BDB161D|nr:sigma-70 family RNA polymerase sigma factor [Curvibacter sp. CHRR-16]MBT0571328.1 sigma-70 family RNA polymerase sigma factor [Curvibacter sp. CHRR-16]
MSASIATASSASLEQMYRLECGWLTGWLRAKMGVHPDRAADLTQDTFVRVLLDTSRAEIRQPRSYLATIARGLAIDLFRRQDLEQAYADYLAHTSLDTYPSPESQALVLEALHTVDRLLQGLKPKAREAFLLSQLEGLTYAEIAKTLDLSVSCVKKYMVQAVTHCLLHPDLQAYATEC